MKKFWRRLLGYSPCPICKEQTVKWVKDWIYHPEEPPMLGHWQCVNSDCLVRTEIESTAWADKIAQEHGYPTFKDALTRD